MGNDHVIKLKSVIKEPAIVFIDAANFEHSVREIRVTSNGYTNEVSGTPQINQYWSVNYDVFKDFFSNTIHCNAIRYYSASFEYDSHKRFCYFLKKELGFKLVTKPIKKYKKNHAALLAKKANFDVEIAVDAIYQINNFNTLILFSGDSDFEYLVRFLRGHGKIVIGFSKSGNISNELLSVLTHYFDIDNFKDEFLKITKNPEPSGRDSSDKIR